MECMLYFLLFLEILFITALLLTIVHNVMSLYGGFRFAPYVPTAQDRVEIMLRLARISPGKKVIELGSGDGRILIGAAKQGAQAIGFETDPYLVVKAKLYAKFHSVSDAVEFRCADIWKQTWPHDTEIVFVYGLPRFMGRVWEKACKELRPGTKIISNAFPVPGVTPIQTEGAVEVYEIPQKIA